MTRGTRERAGGCGLRLQSGEAAPELQQTLGFYVVRFGEGQGAVVADPVGRESCGLDSYIFAIAYRQLLQIGGDEHPAGGIDRECARVETVRVDRLNQPWFAAVLVDQEQGDGVLAPGSELLAPLSIRPAQRLPT
jgi:hypothetical protein